MGTTELHVDPCTTCPGCACRRPQAATPPTVTGGGLTVAPQLPTPPVVGGPPAPPPFWGNADAFDFTTPPPAPGTAGVGPDPVPVPAATPPAAAPTIPIVPVGTPFADAIGFAAPAGAAPTRQPVGHDALDDPTT